MLARDGRNAAPLLVLMADEWGLLGWWDPGTGACRDGVGGGCVERTRVLEQRRRRSHVRALHVSGSWAGSGLVLDWTGGKGGR